MDYSWLCLLPFLVVIPVSILSKQVHIGLFTGLILGSYLIHPDLLGGVKTLAGYVVVNMMQENNIRIIIFLYVFAGLINLAKITGGIKGFVNSLGNRVKTKRTAMLLTWLSTIGTFSAPNLRVMTVAPIMKALRQKLPISKQEIGFVIEVTANPVISLVPIATAFIGYMISITGTALQNAGIKEAPYTVYIQSIPFNFFSFVILAMGIYYSFFHEFGGKREQKELMQNSHDHDSQSEECLEECYRDLEKGIPGKSWNLILPLIFVLLGTFFLSWWDGHTQATGFFDAFLKADTLGVMLQALFFALIVSLAFYLFQRFNVAKLVTHFVKGGNSLVSVIVMLSLIWALSAVSEDLGFSKYIAAHVVGWVPRMFIAPMMFLMGALISYFIGSNWGAWGLLMPLGVTLAHQSGANILLVVGAVFASGTFGAFASPLSDNTVTVCAILDMPLMKYTRLKLTPSLVAAAITTVLFIVFSMFMQ